MSNDTKYTSIPFADEDPPKAELDDEQNSGNSSTAPKLGERRKYGNLSLEIKPVEVRVDMYKKNAD